MKKPKLPRGMILRGKTYWWRDRRGGVREHWENLGRNRAEAERRFHELKGSGAIPGPRFTVEQASRRWLEGYVPARRSPKGVKLAEYRLKRYLYPFCGYRPLGRLKTEDLWEYRRHLDHQLIGPQTVAHVLSDLRCLLGWCEDTGLIQRSPFPRRVLPRIQERPPDRLTDPEVERLMDLPEPYLLTVRLGLATGLRWGELCRAQVAHLEDGKLVVSQTKSGRVRRIPISDDLLAELGLRCRVGKLVPFSGSSSGAFNRAVRRRTRLEGFHVHQLRHTFACRYLEARGSLPALQELLGHKSITTTQRYARLADCYIEAEARGVLQAMAER